MRLPLVFFCAALVAAASQAAFAANGNPQKRHNAKDSLVAQSVLLRQADLGSGWKAGSGSSAADSSCGIILNLQPDESSLVETGQATAPLYSRGQAQAVTQSVRVFATPKQLDTAWARTVTKRLVICEEQRVESASGMGSPVSVTNWSLLRLPHLVDRVYGLRVTATARIGQNETWKNPSKVYFDVILLAHGRAMTRIVLSSLRTPLPATYEQRIERTAAKALKSSQNAS